MKKFLSLAVVIAMVLSFAVIPASASADATITLAVTGDTGAVGDILTLTGTITGVTEVFNWQCNFSFDASVLKPYSSQYSMELNPNQASFALSSSVFDDVTPGLPMNYYKSTGVKYENDLFMIYASTSGSDAGVPVPVSADGYTVFTATFKRIAEGDIKFAFGTETNKPNVRVSASDTVDANAVLNYTAPGAAEVWTPSGEAPAGETIGAVKFPTTAGGEAAVTTYAKKVAVFAKNTTAAELAIDGYSVTIGGVEYFGKIAVPVGKYWSIVLVDTDGSQLTAASYDFTAKVGEETKAGTVAPVSAN